MMINLCSSSDDGAGDDAGDDAGDGETKQAGGTIGAAFSELGNARICAFLGESRGKVASPVLDCSVPGLTYLRASAATWKTKEQMGDDYVENRGLDDFWEDACDAVRTTRPVNPFRMIEQLAKRKADALDLVLEGSKRVRAQRKDTALAVVKERREWADTEHAQRSRAIDEAIGDGMSGSAAVLAAVTGLDAASARVVVAGCCARTHLVLRATPGLAGASLRAMTTVRRARNRILWAGGY